MDDLQLTDCELIYTAEIHFTDIVDYGISMEEISSGTIPVPPEGARFDQTFEGFLDGSRLRGWITGTDYLNVRADGLFQLHLHGRVTTEDGINISLSSVGVSRQVEGESLAHLRSAVSLFTTSSTYNWLNILQLWATGTFDPIKSEAHIKAYSV